MLGWRHERYIEVRALCLYEDRPKTIEQESATNLAPEIRFDSAEKGKVTEWNERNNEISRAEKIAWKAFNFEIQKQECNEMTLVEWLFCDACIIFSDYMQFVILTIPIMNFVI
jgi:hypothetical protein